MTAHGANTHIIFGTGQRIFAAPAALAPVQPDEIVSMPTSDVFHTLLFGQSGAGKSYQLVTYCTELLHKGIGFTLLDCSGDTFHLLQETICSLGYFDHHPAPFENLIALDLPRAFKQGYYPEINILNAGFNAFTSADLVTESFKRLFGTSDSMTTILSLLKAGTYVLAVNNLPLSPFLYYLLTDVAFRTQLLHHAPDELIKQFFHIHTSPRTGQLQLGADATLRRLFLLLFSPALRYPLAAMNNPIFDSRCLIGQNRSVMVNLCLPNKDAMRLLGAMIVVLAEYGARARAEIAAAERKEIHVLCADEAHNLFSQSATGIATMLQEARKWGLYTLMCTQSPEAAADMLKSAMDNVDIIISYRLARPGAEQLVSRFGFPIQQDLIKDYGRTTPHYYSRTEQEQLCVQALTELNTAEAFIRLRNKGVYKMRSLTVPNPRVDPGTLAEIQQEYLRRYFVSQRTVEQGIAHQRSKFQGSDTSDVPDVPILDEQALLAQSIREDTDDLLKD